MAITVEEVRQRLQLEWRLIVFMFNHGGGWVLGDFPTHVRFVRDPVSEPGAAAVLGVGVAGSRIEFRVVFQQAVEHDGSFPQRARDGLLVKPQAVGVMCSSGKIESIGDRVALGAAGRFPAAFASCEPSYADS